MAQGNRFLGLFFVTFLTLPLFGSPTLLDNPLYRLGDRTKAPQNGVVYQDHYLDTIQPVLGARCVACHGCFEAPCQLNLQSYEGLRRGYNPEPIYNTKRYWETKPTRMIDAASMAEWRAKLFLPVVDSTGVEAEKENADASQSILYRLLTQSEKTNVANFKVNNLRDFQQWMDDNTSRVCVASDKQYADRFKGFRKNPWGVVPLNEFLQKWPSAGMPFGLPVSKEHEPLKQWILAGAIGPSQEAQARLESPSNREEIQRWEDFLNNRSNKGLHVGRYIYEHVYTAHANFKSNPGEFFFLVRSKTKSGPIEQIVTELPYEAPGGEVFYRFRKITDSIVHKTHFVWTLDDTKLARLKKLFVEDWKADESTVPAPSYVNKKGYTNPNPFEYFAPIPAMSRATFMIENSRVIVGAMTQGSVCVGTTATFAINDHFWAWFLRPERDVSVLFPNLGLANWDTLATAPVANESAAAHFERTRKAHAKYEEAYEIKLRQWLKSQPNGAKGLAVTDLWKGDGDPSYPKGNPNAWLNITRHERSTTVQFGPEGGTPHSIWVMSYSNFERLYYNLVASFREWGSLDHKAATWRHMSYVRIEGEDLAISFLPIAYRKEMRNRFAQGISYFRNIPYPQYSTMGLDDQKHIGPLHRADLPARPEGTANPGTDADSATKFLVNAVKSHLAPGVASINDQPVAKDRKDFERQLLFYQTLSRERKGLPYTLAFPNVAYLRVEGDQGESWIYSLVTNRAYTGHNDMFIQKRMKELDTFSVYRGFKGGYPNVFLDIKKADRRKFIEAIAKLGTKELTWEAFRARYAVARNSPRFWSFFDALHELKAVAQPGVDPVDEGIIDLSQYEIFEE